jgi:hypothetical protein
MQMSVLDHAATRLPAEPATPQITRRTPRVTPARAAIAFAAAQAPLVALAYALGWRGDWTAANEPAANLADYILDGSAISGPLMPQLIFLTLAFLASRRGRAALVGAAGIGVMGVLVTINGSLAATSDATDAPRAALIAAGIGFTTAGLTFIALSIRALRNRR